MALYALFDIGGTAIKYGVSDAEGHFVKNDTVNNPAKEKGIRGMLDVLERLLLDMKAEFDICGT